VATKLDIYVLLLSLDWYLVDYYW